MMAKKRRERRGVVFQDGEAVLASEIAGVDGDTSEAKRRDGEKGNSGSANPSNRECNGESMLDWSTIRMLKAVACNAVFWGLAEHLDEKHKPTKSTRGRRRKHNAMDWILVWMLSARMRSVRAAIAELGDDCEYFKDAETYRQLQRIAERVWPNHKDRRLSDKPMTRSQYMYYRDECLDYEDALFLRWAAAESGIEQALFMGMFDPKSGSLTNPDKSQGLIGDASFFRTMCDIWKATERNADKYDPDAVAYHTGEKGKRHKARGHKNMYIGARNSERNERIILCLDGDIQNEGPEGDYFAMKVREMAKAHPEMLDGIRFAVYDMAMSAKNHDELHDLGIVSLGKVPRTSTGKSALMNLGLHSFTLMNGTKKNITVTAIDGSACISGVSVTGEVWYKPLTLKAVDPRPSGGRKIIYLDFEVPDYELFSRSLVGATVRIRLNSTKDEIWASPKHRRRSRAMRAFAEGTTQQFTDLFGLREDSESAFSDMKNGARGRTRSVGGKRHQLDLTAYQLLNNMEALVAYYKRTGADVSRWWGDYSPIRIAKPRQEARDGPLRKVA